MRPLGQHPGRSLLTLLALLLSTLSGARVPVSAMADTGSDETRSVAGPAVERVREAASAATVARHPVEVDLVTAIPQRMPAPTAASCPAPGPRLGRARAPRAP